jgi:hypothetical protein
MGGGGAEKFYSTHRRKKDKLTLKLIIHETEIKIP